MKIDSRDYQLGLISINKEEISMFKKLIAFAVVCLVFWPHWVFAQDSRPWQPPIEAGERKVSPAGWVLIGIGFGSGITFFLVGIGLSTEDGKLTSVQWESTDPKEQGKAACMVGGFIGLGVAFIGIITQVTLYQVGKGKKQALAPPPNGFTVFANNP